MNAAAMGEFTKAEFMEGMLKMGVDSVDKLKKKLPDLRAELSNPDRFHDIYNYAYLFSREVSLHCVSQCVLVLCQTMCACFVPQFQNRRTVPSCPNRTANCLPYSHNPGCVCLSALMCAYDLYLVHSA